jgi:AAA+ ATPase superfamily predicted ATPase
VTTILSVLERLEKLTEKHNKKVILFFDEFQQVGEITNDTSLESAVREIAQRAKNIVFIFSGSNRHLLNEMFSDKKRPFYRMCERIELHRIERKAYIPYMQKAAVKKWDEKLPVEVIDGILEKTERHSYYTNMLCSILWRASMAPTLTEVENVWDRYVKQERSQVSYELDLLSKNQRKLLIALIREEGTDMPRGSEFVSAARMSSATIGQSLDYLLKKDYVYKTHDEYFKVLDPLTKAVIEESSS